jgi:hypothetical protein
LIACFFGDPGSIQGYQTIFDVTTNVNYDISGVDAGNSTKASSIDSYADDVPWVQTKPGSSAFAGTARFILKLQL